jgi:polysaccharide biosynthesis protein VpsQ
MPLKRWLPFSVFFLFVVGIIVANDLGQIQSIISWVNSIPFGDKVGHTIFIGTLAYLLNYALIDRTIKIGHCKILLGCVIIAVAITLEEFSQIWIPSRTFDLIDMAANYAGIVIASWLRLSETSN